MQPIAGSLSETDVQALAGYFAALRGVPGAEAEPPDAALVRAGETLARVGAALDPTPASMTAVAARLDETQIRQAAAYLSTRPGP
jgi:cytochrome c553